MKPLNLDNKPCSPISSNCVVWQGPDIPCIKLCIGDTVSDVVFAMATELCTILDTLKVTNYDLTCFNINSCGPQDFQALIQFLITQICELQGVTVAPTKEQTCPDCVVSVADCFVTGTQTTMQLVDYVQLIGERVCSIITEISLINTQITDILIRVTTLENAPVPTFTIPSFTITCQIGSLLSGTTQPIDTLLQEFINSIWCGFYAVTGSSTDLTNAINTQEPCITETSETITKPGTTYPSEYPAWVAEPSTVADSITNIWLVLCDLHTALSAGQTITVADTATIDLTLSGTEVLTADVTDTGWINIEGFSYYGSTAFRPACRRIGNVLHFRGTIIVPIGTSTDGHDGTASPITSSSSYNILQKGGVLSTFNSTDPDACFMETGPGMGTWDDTFEAIKIHFNRGVSCIPSGILTGSETLDDLAGSITGKVLGTRFTKSGSDDVILSASISVNISSAGILKFASTNFEDYYLTSSGQTVGRSNPLRQLNSNAVTGAEIPLWNNAAPSQFGATAAGVYTPQINASASRFTFNQDMSRADETGGLQINISSLRTFITV